MSNITIEVWDATGNKKQLVELPADAMVDRVIAVLVEKLNMPQFSPDGQLMSYKFQHRASGRQLLDEETLAGAGVRDGDVVRLLPEITAGTHAVWKGLRIGGIGAADLSPAPLGAGWQRAVGNAVRACTNRMRSIPIRALVRFVYPR